MKFKNYIFYKICNKIYKHIYALLRFCERKNGREEEIKSVQNKISSEIKNAVNIKKELEIVSDIIFTKDEYIDLLHTYLIDINSNFNKKDYDEVKRLLKKINLPKEDK